MDQNQTELKIYFYKVKIFRSQIILFSTSCCLFLISQTYLVPKTKTQKISYLLRGKGDFQIIYKFTPLYSVQKRGFIYTIPKE